MPVTNSSDRPALRYWYAGGALLVIVAALGLLVVLKTTGLGGRAKNWVNRSLTQLRCAGDTANLPADAPRVMFLHHSVGHNLIEQGCARELFAQAGYALWDHGYNAEGLRDPSGQSTGISYAIPNDNTDPDGLYALFQQEVTTPPSNAFSHLLEYDIILFKSCFPASQITSEVQFRQRQQWYLEMRAVMDRYPDQQFVVLTQPPLNPAETDAEAAARARRFAQWLASAEFLEGHPNIRTFDLFDALAEPDGPAADANMLRAAYRSGIDSHPNQLANQTVAPLLVEFVTRP